MYKLKIPKVDFPMGPFPFPLCFDMTLALLLAYHGLDYRACFSGCYAAEFHPEKSTLEELLIFPGYDRSKYERAGIVIEKQKVTCAQEMAAILRAQLLRGSPVMLHFDGYDCPWDKNLFRRQHNEHTVLATGISRGGKLLKVCDLLFHKHQRTVWAKRVMRHCQFYYQIKVPKALYFDADRPPRSCLQAFYQTLLRFIDDVEEHTEFLALEKEDTIATKLFSLLQRGRISHHFYSMYLDFLTENGSSEAKKFCKSMHEAQYVWGDCLFYLLQSNAEHRYCPHEMITCFRALAECYRKMIALPEERTA